MSRHEIGSPPPPWGCHLASVADWNHVCCAASKIENEKNKKKDIEKWQANLSGWWFQPLWKSFEKYWSKWEIFPKIGVNIKNPWNHHPNMQTCGFFGTVRPETQTNNLKTDHNAHALQSTMDLDPSARHRIPRSLLNVAKNLTHVWKSPSPGNGNSMVLPMIF